jgi:hypothetical protein
MDAYYDPFTLMDEWNQSPGNFSSFSDGSFKNGHSTAAWIVVISPTCMIVGGQMRLKPT